MGSPYFMLKSSSKHFSRSGANLFISALFVLPILGFFVGCVCAAYWFNVQLLVDYDSAKEMQIYRIGPWKVRAEFLEGEWFGFVVINNGSNGLTGSPDWHTATLFERNSQRSANFEGGHVLKQIKRIESLLRNAEAEDVKNVKENYLRSLSGGVDNADIFVDQLETKLRTYGKGRN